MAVKSGGICLTGIRVSGRIHLGNYLGAMKQAIERQSQYESYFFVADLHGLTTTPAAAELRENARSIAATWLAIGLDPQKTVLWMQSDVKEVLELAYVLSCVTSMGLLERAHSYKDALAKDKVVKMGLFYYPILMAADILLYDSDLVPVGKDQAQHLEMTRDIATFFNETYGETFKLPAAITQEETGAIPGTDGRKMSKSYKNGIDLFAPESELKRQIMGIVTDSKGLQDPKDPEACVVYQLYRLIAPAADSKAMADKLRQGGYGYGDAKKALLAATLDHFGPMRQNYDRWMKDPHALDAVLNDGAERARRKASKMLSRVRERVGL